MRCFPLHGFLVPLFVLLWWVLSVSTAQAAVQWSLSVVEGVYLPQLKTLNRILTHERVELGPRNVEARPNPYPVVYQGNSPVMPEMEVKAPKFGLQVQADLNPRYALVLGGSIETLESQRRDIRPFFVGFWIDSSRETRFALALNQIWFGARRYLEIPKGSKGRLYGEMGIIGITGATLSTDVWLHVLEPDEGFDFYKVTSTASRGTGYATYVGTGGEYPLKKWLALSLDLQYVVGGVSNLRWTRYFTADPLEAGLIQPGEVVKLTDLERGSLRPLFLELDGWDFKGRVVFYF